MLCCFICNCFEGCFAAVESELGVGAAGSLPHRCSRDALPLFLVKVASLGVEPLSPPPERHRSLASPARPPRAPRGKGFGVRSARRGGVNHFPWRAELVGWFAAQQRFPGPGFLVPQGRDKPRASQTPSPAVVR